MADDARTPAVPVSTRPAGTVDPRRCEELVRDAFWDVQQVRPGQL